MFFGKNTPVNPLLALGFGLAAGVAGTAAMTAYQYAVSAMRRLGGSGESDGEQGEQEQRDPWSEAPAPAQVGYRVIKGVFQREVSPDRISLLNNAVHWGYGTTWGAAYGLVAGTGGVSPIWGGLVLAVVVWLAGYVVLPAMKLYEPIWTYGPRTLAIDLSYHLAYGFGVAYAFWALDTKL